MPGLSFTSLSESVFKSLFRLLFRYDIFISYARGDGKEYAVKLRDQLKQLDFSCFLDFDELPAGNSLNNTLKRAIKKSAALVVVGTERAVKSRYVELEVGEFSATGRAIIPIDIEGTLADTPWSVIKERDIVWIDEVKAALTKGVPSPNVADSIDKLFTYTRRNSRVRAQVLSTIVLFVVVVVAALFMIRQQVNAATLASAKAISETIKSNEQKAVADAAILESEKQKTAANTALNNAKIAEDHAKVAENKATIAKKAAGDAAREAKRQEKIALTNARRAQAEQARAEERTQYVTAQQIGVQAEMGGDRGELDRSILLSVESLKRALTPEGYIAWEKGLNLLPHPADMEIAPAEKNVSAIAYSPDGRFFAQGTTDGVVTLFETRREKSPVTLQSATSKPVQAIIFGNAGSWVAAVSEHEVNRWDTKTFEPATPVNSRFDDAIAFSPDGRYLALTKKGPSNWVQILDLANSSRMIRKHLEEVKYVMGIAFSPNGKWLALGCHALTEGQGDPAGKIIFWDVKSFDQDLEATPKPVATIPTEEGIYIVAFSPSGRYFAAGGDRELNIWSLSEKEGDRSEEAEDQAFSYEEVSRLTISNDELALMGSRLMFSPDENYLATVGVNNARMWEISTRREVSRIKSEKDQMAFAFRPGRHLFATADNDFRFWNMEFGSGARRLPLHDGSDNRLLAMTMNPGGEWLATGSTDGARVFRTTDWSPIVTLKEAGDVSRLAFDSTGRWLITVSHKQVTAFDTKNWSGVKVISLTDKSATPGIGFSPDKRWLAVWIGKVLKLFEYGSWREVHTMNHTEPVSEALFGPDSRWVTVHVNGWYQNQYGHSAGERSRTYVWDLNTGLPVACKTERDTLGPNVTKGEPPETSAARKVVCPDVNPNQRSVLPSEGTVWEPIVEFGVRPTTSHDHRWSVDASSMELSLVDGKALRKVATVDQGRFEFTSDDRWLVIGDGKAIILWPLKPADMIDEACTRLRRRDLTVDEWKQYFSEEKHQPTCPLKE